jgi:hypothetical protein
LEHSIGKRPVFAQDPLDDTEIETAEWTAVNEAVKAGVPLEFYLLEERQWPQDKIDRLSFELDQLKYKEKNGTDAKVG